MKMKRLILSCVLLLASFSCFATAVTVNVTWAANDNNPKIMQVDCPTDPALPNSQVYSMELGIINTSPTTIQTGKHVEVIARKWSVIKSAIDTTPNLPVGQVPITNNISWVNDHVSPRGTYSIIVSKVSDDNTIVHSASVRLKCKSLDSTGAVVQSLTNVIQN